MIKLAGGSVFLGTIALLGGFLFYLQPTVEAVTLASQSPNKQSTQFTDQFNSSNSPNKEVSSQDSQDLQFVQPIEQTQTQPSKSNSENKSVILPESSSFRATAYCLKGKTAMGSSVRRGIVAADPRHLPLGSRIQVNAGAYSGIYMVTDTGGAVRGRKLDIWVPNCSEAARFGRKNITVSRLGKKS